MALNDLQPPEGLAAIPYTQGVSAEVAKRASLTRFLPGSILSLGTAALLFVDGVSGVGEWVELVVYLGLASGALTLGYRAGLEILRARLYPDAEVDGRRSFIAGLMSPIAAFVAGVLATPVLSSGWAIVGALFTMSLLLAVLMFFAWLTPTPEEMRGAKYALDAWSAEEG